LPPRAERGQGLLAVAAEVLRRIRQAAGDAPASTWQAYLRFHAIDGASPYLSTVPGQPFEFYGKTLNGQPEQKPRWKRVLGTVNSGMGMALGQLYVKEFPPEAKARADARGQRAQCAEGAHRKLDWMSPKPSQGLEKWSTFLPKIGYPDKWRNWDGLRS
jgi:putative endopeptidase